ncbi:IS66 family insertion sequence element accessory protein TnpB [Escherichia coli]|uniref:IS66 family insertion sequence element accessory protein TnpB n=3 Tax=Escherichia coli TaxID=562 RepID=UPI001834977D|nr:IS66 family insertion sequence element accessory protein TnpB [Escherichia coli]EFH7650113.1 IS66 family insertion sequence element accessory protein TnpB [Escherichia coli]EFN4859101.1 IS66 family insertion sequence element accessory protein TnpB [Escherichia coli]EFO2507619.1 transposase [Escherichia coli]EFO2868729.1 transposase [Escherichia coli]
MLNPQCLWLVRQPADMRAGITTLTHLATVAAGHPPRDGEAFLFTGKNRTRMKLLMWDRHGVWLCTRRLHRGTFHWPRDGDLSWSLTAEQFTRLTAGVDWQRLSAGPLPAWTE